VTGPVIGGVFSPFTVRKHPEDGSGFESADTRTSMMWSGSSALSKSVSSLSQLSLKSTSSCGETRERCPIVASLAVSTPQLCYRDTQSNSGFASDATPLVRTIPMAALAIFSVSDGLPCVSC
jgi:hypothetical protein